MNWRDHLLEWGCAIGVFIGTLVVLSAIEGQEQPDSVPPAAAQPLSPAPAAAPPQEALT